MRHRLPPLLSDPASSSSTAPAGLLLLHPPSSSSPSDSDRGRGRRLLLLVLLRALDLGGSPELLGAVLPLLACRCGSVVLVPPFQQHSQLRQKDGTG